MVAVQDIFRRYPNSYESVIVELCAALEVLEEPDAKAAMVWIIGEYAERIDNADELLGYLLDNFLDEPVAVQLQLLTAAVKLFLKKPGQPDAQTMISTVLTAATQQTDNPDLRDRAYLYWRLLSAMPEVRCLLLQYIASVISEYCFGCALLLSGGTQAATLNSECSHCFWYIESYSYVLHC